MLGQIVLIELTTLANRAADPVIFFWLIFTFHISFIRVVVNFNLFSFCTFIFYSSLKSPIPFNY